MEVKLEGEKEGVLRIFVCKRGCGGTGVVMREGRKTFKCTWCDHVNRISGAAEVTLKGGKQK